MKLIHYYHIYCGGGGQWQLIMHQHMMALCNYGLIEQLDEIRVGIVGPPDQRKAVKEILDNSLVAPKIRIVVTRTNAFEQATLTEMYKASQTEDAAYLYGHTKGSSDPSLINQLWCRSMVFFNIVAWERAIAELANVDCVGAYWLTKEEFPQIADHNNPDGYPYFAGTFWWAKSSHIRELSEPVREHRWQAEHWIGKREGMTVYNSCKGWPGPDKFVITF